MTSPFSKIDANANIGTSDSHATLAASVDTKSSWDKQAGAETPKIKPSTLLNDWKKWSETNDITRKVFNQAIGEIKPFFVKKTKEKPQGEKLQNEKLDNLENFFIRDKSVGWLPPMPENVRSIVADNIDLKHISDLPPKLKALRVNDNFLKTLPDLGPSVTKAFARDNNIESIPEFSQNLRMLDLKRNNIKKIPQHLLKGSPDLVVDLRFNPITREEVDAFKGVAQSYLDQGIQIPKIIT